MANIKISEYSELTGVADGDLIEIVDVSDTSMATSGTNKKITKSNLVSDRIPTSYLDTDGTLSANSDVKIPSQKAVKTYADTKATLAAVYPVGSIYISTVSTNPSALFGFGTWAAFAAGRTLIGVGTSDQAFTAGATGGESTHLLTGAESGEKGHTHSDAGHTHPYLIDSGTGPNRVTRTDIGNQTQNTYTGYANIQAVAASNASSAHNNLQPYIVTYMWQRTA